MTGFEPEDYETGDDYDVDYEEDDPDGVGGECALTVCRGIYTCGMAGSEDCDFDCIYSHLIGKKVTRGR